MSDPTQQAKAHAVGINHVALEVGDIDEALEFYGRFLHFEIERRSDTAAFVYFGDQFINFTRHADRSPDAKRHFGIAVDDKPLVRRILEAWGVALLDGPFLDFLDPWGNRVEITTYRDIRYSKADHVLRGMGLGHLTKSEKALAELRARGMAPDVAPSTAGPVTPVLRILDEAKAREFYLDFLGFALDWEHRFDARAPLYMQVSRDGCVLHLSEHHGDGTPGAALRIEVCDLDGYHRELTAKGYRYLRPGIEDMPWGTRDMTLRDPFGNRLVFTGSGNGPSESAGGK